MASLLSIDESMTSDSWVVYEDSSDSDSELADLIEDGLSYTMFYGPCANLHCYVDDLQVFVARDVPELVLTANTHGHGVDIAEICGGEGRTSQLGVRRHLKVGKNFDLVTHTDLANPRDAAAAYNYFVEADVLVAVMAPLCDCLGPLSHLNWSINHETMTQKCKVGSAVARFCGRAARLQLHRQRDFLCEQPYPSNLYDEGDWPKVMLWPGVEQIPYDRCRCGLKVLAGPCKGLAIRKPSAMTVSCRELGDPFRNLKCLERHEHLQGLGHSKEHSQAQVWTWEEVDRVIKGCVAVVRRHRRGFSTAYPTYYPVDRSSIARATPGGIPLVRGRDPNALPVGAGSPCAGCRHYRGRNDIEHNRKVGECGYPYDEPMIFCM